MSIQPVLVGAKGDTGAAGQNGVSPVCTSGTGVPTGGSNGDTYIRTTNNDFYLKSAGVWNVIANIKGATGDTGATGAAGPGYPTQTGNAGKHLETNGTNVSWVTPVTSTDLDAKLDINTFNTTVTNLSGDIASKVDTGTFESYTSSASGDISTLQSDVSSLSGQVDGIVRMPEITEGYLHSDSESNLSWQALPSDYSNNINFYGGATVTGMFVVNGVLQPSVACPGWNETTDYYVGQFILHGGSTVYLCITSHSATNIEPNTSPENWQKISFPSIVDDGTSVTFNVPTTASYDFAVNGSLGLNGQVNGPAFTIYTDGNMTLGQSLNCSDINCGGVYASSGYSGGAVTTNALYVGSTAYNEYTITVNGGEPTIDFYNRVLTSSSSEQMINWAGNTPQFKAGETGVSNVPDNGFFNFMINRTEGVPTSINIYFTDETYGQMFASIPLGSSA